MIFDRSHFSLTDDDGASRRTRERRRQSDIDFLAWVRSGPPIEILFRHVVDERGPQWRRVALMRAIMRAK